MTSSENKNLRETLHDMQSTLHVLISLLDEELQVLAECNPESMTALAVKKQHLCEKLEQLEARRAHLSDGTSEATQNGDSEALWNTVVEMARCAQKKNNVNGIVAENGRRQTRHIMGLLQGRPGELLTYGVTGNTIESDGNNSTIARA